MKKFYTALLHGIDEGGTVDISFPDFPGCISQGKDLSEALLHGREALELQLEGLIEDDVDIPTGTDDAKVRECMAECDESVLPTVIEIEVPEGKKERVNVMISQFALNKADNYARQHNMTRSGFLQTAAIEYLDHHACKC